MDKVVKQDAEKFARKISLDFAGALKVLTNESLDKITSYFGLSEQLQKEEVANLVNELKSMQQYYLDRIKLATTQEERERIDEQSAKIFVKIMEQKSELNQRHIDERKFNKEKIVDVLKSIVSIAGLGILAVCCCNKNETSEDENNHSSNDKIVDVDYEGDYDNEV